MSLSALLTKQCSTVCTVVSHKGCDLRNGCKQGLPASLAVPTSQVVQLVSCIAGVSEDARFCPCSYTQWSVAEHDWVPSHPTMSNAEGRKGELGY